MFARHTLNSFTRFTAHSAVLRSLHSKPEPLPKNAQEIEIKVPWGKVAAVLWGNQDKQPVLALHGWQDNAGSFKCLAPLLLRNASILAIDMPGHGLSSWLPPGIMYYELAYIMTIERVKQYFAWQKVKLMGHSLGAQTCFWYASLFPEETEFVIALDCLKFPSIDVPQYNKMFANAIRAHIKTEMQEGKPPGYTETEVISRWLAASGKSLDEAACRTLMTRGVTKVENGKYMFNRDPRLKVIPIHSAFTHDHLQEAAKLITCPYLVVKAKGSSYFEDKNNFEDIIQIMKGHNEHVHSIMLPGMHHFHMTSPKAVALVVNPFLESYN